MDTYGAFRFRIRFSGLDVSKPSDASFQSITGLEAYIDIQEPDRKSQLAPIIFPSLVLKRIVSDINDSPLSQWIFSWIDQKSNHSLPEATIELLDDNNQRCLSWNITDIVPKSWKLGELDAGKSEMLLETIELSYAKLTFNIET